MVLGITKKTPVAASVGTSTPSRSSPERSVSSASPGLRSPLSKSSTLRVPAGQRNANTAGGDAHTHIVYSPLRGASSERDAITENAGDSQCGRQDDTTNLKFSQAVPRGVFTWFGTGYRHLRGWCDTDSSIFRCNSASGRVRNAICCDFAGILPTIQVSFTRIMQTIVRRWSVLLGFMVVVPLVSFSMLAVISNARSHQWTAAGESSPPVDVRRESKREANTYGTGVPLAWSCSPGGHSSPTNHLGMGLAPLTFVRAALPTRGLTLVVEAKTNETGREQVIASWKASRNVVEDSVTDGNRPYGFIAGFGDPFAIASGVGGTGEVCVRISASGNLEYSEFADSNSLVAANPAVNIADGRWHIVAVGRTETGVVRLFADGAVVGSGWVGAALPKGLSHTAAMSYSNMGDVFNGSIRNFRVYDEILNLWQLDVLKSRSCDNTKRRDLEHFLLTESKSNENIYLDISTKISARSSWESASGVPLVVSSFKGNNIVTATTATGRGTSLSSDGDSSKSAPVLNVPPPRDMPLPPIAGPTITYTSSTTTTTTFTTSTSSTTSLTSSTSTSTRTTTTSTTLTASTSSTTSSTKTSTFSTTFTTSTSTSTSTTRTSTSTTRTTTSTSLTITRTSATTTSTIPLPTTSHRLHSDTPGLRAAAAVGGLYEVAARLNDGDVCARHVKVSIPVHRQPFTVSPSEMGRCYGWAKSNGRTGAVMSSRNWCWVGLKEAGCHASLFRQHPRPHFTWKHMSDIASKFGATPARAPGQEYEPLLNPEVCDRSWLGAENFSWTPHDWVQARAWFNDHVEVYVLNLAQDWNRLQGIKERLDHLGIAFTRVEGVDLRPPHAFMAAQREGLLPFSYDFDAAQKEANAPSNNMGGVLGTAGCAAGHFRAHQQALSKAPKTYFNAGPVSFNGSKSPQITIPASDLDCPVARMHFRADVMTKGYSESWILSYQVAPDAGFSIGIKMFGTIECTYMGQRIQGGALNSGNLVTVVASWDGSTFECVVDGASIGRIHGAASTIPCQGDVLIGPWFKGTMSNLAFNMVSTRHIPKPVTLIFEDDAHPSKDFIPRVWHLLREEMPCDWSVVGLRSMCSFGTCISPHVSRVQPDVNEPEGRCRHGVNYGFQGVLYRTGALESLDRRWREVVFDVKKPHCLDVDVALAAISDELGYYAVPFVQVPGFLQESNMGSSRSAINDR